MPASARPKTARVPDINSLAVVRKLKNGSGFEEGVEDCLAVVVVLLEEVCVGEELLWMASFLRRRMVSEGMGTSWMPLSCSWYSSAL
jgi:hypothetical protein